MLHFTRRFERTYRLLGMAVLLSMVLALLTMPVAQAQVSWFHARTLWGDCYPTEVIRATTYTVTPSDYGQVIVLAGSAAQTITMPNPPTAGTHVQFVLAANVGATIAAATSQSLYANGMTSTAYSKVRFSTSSHLIGASVLLISLPVSATSTTTHWFAINQSDATMSPS